MNTFAIIIIAYFLVAGLLEIFNFRKYVSGKEDLSKKEILAMHFLCWLWPVDILVMIVLFCFVFVGKILK